jgi:hypothetical protein
MWCSGHAGGWTLSQRLHVVVPGQLLAALVLLGSRHDTCTFWVAFNLGSAFTSCWPNSPSLVPGAALGTGSAMAHRAVDAMMGPRGGSAPAEAAPAPAAPLYSPAQPSGPCAEQAKAFAECMSRSNGDMGACTLYFDSMQQCKLNHGVA